MTSAPSTKKIIIQYEKDYLLSLKDSPECNRWPSVLSKRCVTRGGYWDPVQSFKPSKSVEPEIKEARPRSVTGSTTSGYNPRDMRRRKRGRDDRDSIVLGPPQRSWGTGCHVSQGRPTSESSERPSRGTATVTAVAPSTRRPPQSESRGGSTYSGYTRGGDREDYYNKESSRFYSDRPSPRQIPAREYGAKRVPYGRDRDDRDRYDYERERPEHYNRDSGRNYRERGAGHHKQSTYASDEPEWMSEGPSYFTDTIELVGIQDGDAISKFKKRSAPSIHSSDDEESTSQDMEPTIESSSKSPGESSSDVAKVEAKTDSSESSIRGSRFKHIFMSRDSTDEYEHQSDSKERDAQLLSIIQSPKHATTQSAKEVENVLKDILLNKKENTSSRSGNVVIPQGLGNGQVRTVDEIEANIVSPPPPTANDGNRGAGDMSAFNKLLGMMSNAAPSTTSNLQAAESSLSSATSEKSSMNLAAKLPEEMGPEHSAPGVPSHPSSHQIDIAAIRNRQNQLQMQMRLEQLSANPINGSSSNRHNYGVGLELPRTVPQSSSNIPQQSNLSSQAVLNQQQQQVFQNLRPDLTATLRAMNNPLSSQYTSSQVRANTFRWLRAMTNAMSASARINQLQNPDANVPPSVQSGLNKTPFSHPSQLGNHQSDTMANNFETPGRPLLKMVESDLSKQFSQKMNIESVYRRQLQQQLQAQKYMDDQAKHTARPIVKTMQENGPSSQQQQYHSMMSAAHSTFPANVNKPYGGHMMQPNYYGSPAAGMVNQSLIQQQMLIQRQLEAKAAALHQQQNVHRSATAFNPVTGNSTNNSALSLNSMPTGSAEPSNLSHLFKNFQHPSQRGAMPPLPNIDDIAVKTLDELEGGHS